MPIYYGNSDGRNGEISIEVPDLRGTINIHNNEISIKGTENNLCLVGQTPDEKKVILKNGEKINFDERDLNEVELWLLTGENEILDFHSKYESHYMLKSLEEETQRSEMLLKIIERGEAQDSEFKVYIDLSDTKNSKSEEIEKTVCALSNANGGYLFIGVTDDGLIDGIDKKVCEQYQDEVHTSMNAYMLDVSKRIREALKYTDCFDISEVKIGKNHVVVITVQRTQEVNYYVNNRVAYIRRGASSFKMKSIEEREETKRLFLE